MRWSELLCYARVRVGVSLAYGRGIPFHNLTHRHCLQMPTHIIITTTATTSRGCLLKVGQINHKLHWRSEWVKFGQKAGRSGHVSSGVLSVPTPFYDLQNVNINILAFTSLKLIRKEIQITPWSICTWHNWLTCLHKQEVKNIRWLIYPDWRSRLHSASSTLQPPPLDFCDFSCSILSTSNWLGGNNFITFLQTDWRDHIGMMAG